MEEKETQIEASKDFNVRSLLAPNEYILWEKDFSEGVIHRHAKATALITNGRILFVDRIKCVVTQSLLIKEIELVVMNRHTSSNSVGGGTYYGHMYSGSRVSSSNSIGDLVFLQNGVSKIRLGGIADPQGVKNLFTSIKKQMLKAPLPKTPSQMPIVAPLSANPVKYCGSCGTELNVDSRFCNKCGLPQP
jgi:hypothetical protein